MSRRRRAFFLAAACLFFSNAAAADTLPARNVLLELFTSQGCSSCPPAEKFLGELQQTDLPADRIVSLAFHVDYWDGIGWKDPFSSKTFTTRQWTYVNSLRIRTAYTPQLVVDGAYEMVGSDRRRVIEAAKSRLSAPSEFLISISVDTSPAAAARVRVTVNHFPPRGLVPKWIFAATFIPESTTRVRAGENAGRTIRQVNIVRALSEPFPFRPDKSGARVAVEFQLPFFAGDGVAAWIQDYRTFTIDQAAIWRK